MIPRLATLQFRPATLIGIDVSTLYIIRAKLYEAADAAALAGTRALSQGPDSATQNSNAASVATRYFNAKLSAQHRAN